VETNPMKTSAHGNSLTGGSVSSTSSENALRILRICIKYRMAESDSNFLLGLVTSSNSSSLTSASSSNKKKKTESKKKIEEKKPKIGIVFRFRKSVLSTIIRDRCKLYNPPTHQVVERAWEWYNTRSELLSMTEEQHRDRLFSDEYAEVMKSFNELQTSSSMEPRLSKRRTRFTRLKERYKILLQNSAQLKADTHSDEVSLFLLNRYLQSALTYRRQRSQFITDFGDCPFTNSDKFSSEDYCIGIDELRTKILDYIKEVDVLSMVSLDNGSEGFQLLVQDETLETESSLRVLKEKDEGIFLKRSDLIPMTLFRVM